MYLNVTCVTSCYIILHISLLHNLFSSINVLTTQRNLDLSIRMKPERLS